MPTYWITHKRALIVVVLALVVCSMLPSGTVNLIARGPQVIVQTLTSPPIALLSRITPQLRSSERELTNGTLTYSELDARHQQALEHNKRLRLKIDRLRQRYHQLKATIAKFEDGVTVVEALVSGLSDSTGNPTLTIARGRRAGIRKGQVAMRGGNLVGEVVNVTPVTADVRLIIAPDTLLRVDIEPPRTSSDSGPGPRQTSLQLQWDQEAGAFTAEPGKRQPIEEGDLAYLNDDAWPLTSEGKIVGKVTRVEPHKRPVLKRIRVEPLVPLKQLNRLAVIVPNE